MMGTDEIGEGVIQQMNKIKLQLLFKAIEDRICISLPLKLFSK